MIRLQQRLEQEFALLRDGIIRRIRIMKITNEEKMALYRKRQYLRIGIIIFSLLTIILAVLSLAIHLGVGYSIITFVITTILMKMFDKTTVVFYGEDKKNDTSKKSAKKPKEKKKIDKKTNKELKK